LVLKGVFEHHHRPKLDRDPQAYYTLSKGAGAKKKR
jgi:hypothetical protein